MRIASDVVCRGSCVVLASFLSLPFTAIVTPKDVDAILGKEWRESLEIFRDWGKHWSQRRRDMISVLWRHDASA